MGNKSKRTLNRKSTPRKRQHTPSPKTGRGDTPRTETTRGLTEIGDSTSVVSQDPDGEHVQTEDAELRSNASGRSSSAASVTSVNEDEGPQGTQLTFTMDDTLSSRGDTPTIHERVTYNYSSPNPNESNAWDHRHSLLTGT